MQDVHDRPRTLFLFNSIRFLSEEEVCGGRNIPEFMGKPCVFSDSGRPPFGSHAPDGSNLISNGDFETPTCVIREVGKLGEWAEDIGIGFTEKYPNRPVYLCLQMFLLILVDP